MRYKTAGIIKDSRFLIRLKTITSIPLLILALCLTSVISMAAFTSTPAYAAPLIETDQPEYMMGETVYVFGSGFTPNQQVIVQVIRVDNSIVTGNGTETPGSDIITVDPYGSFIYPYWLSGGTEAQYYGTLVVNAIDNVTLVTLATTTFLDNPSFGLQGCSRYRGDCTDSATPATGWADGTNPMNGWTSGNVKGWYELEDVPYRLKIKLKNPSDAKIYYITTEHDNLSGGVLGVDSASGFYVGAGDDDDNNYKEGELTKTCVVQAYRTTAPADLPTPSNPCIVTGPTYSGVNDDGNNGIDEDAANGVDNDGDGQIDEDPPPKSSSPGVRRIQYTWAVLFESSEVGNNKKWALYWKAHLASGSSTWPGASLHTQTSAGGSQDVPIQNVLASQQANLSITKTDSPDPVTVGGTLTYNISVTNSGPNSASNVVVTDTIPGSTTFVSASSSQGSCSGTSTVTCNLGTLTNGASATVTIVVIPTTTGSISNQASVTSSTTDPNTSDNTTPWVNTTVNPPPSNVADLSINKTDSTDPVSAGGILTYSITVTNIGPNTATNVTVTDNLPGGVTNINASGSGWTCIMSGYLVTCTRATLAVGIAPDIFITVNAPTSGCSLNNTASVTADQTDPNSANNTVTIATTVNAVANLSITKTAFPDPVTAGGILTYTVTVSNAGPSSASNVIVSDTLPAGTAYIGASGTGWSCSHDAGVVTCNRASLGVTDPPTIPAAVISIQVTAPSDGGTISNSASVSGNDIDPDTGNNNTGPVETMVNASADLSIIKTGPLTVAAGGTMTYTLAVTNNGPSTATSVSVTDTLPSGVTYTGFSGTGWNCTPAPPSGGVVTCTLSSLAATATSNLTIMATAPVTTGSIMNSATVSSGTNDPDTGLNSNTSSAVTAVTASADLSITKSDSPDSVLAGQNLTYLITVTNNGPNAATGVTMTDILPAGVTYVSATPSQGICIGTSTVTCTLGNMNYLASATVTIVVTPIAEGTIYNSASVDVGGNESDPNIGNNTTLPVPTTVDPSADLSITKTGPASVPQVGDNVTYTITVTNNGPSPATGVTVTDTLNSLTYGSVTTTQGTCTGWPTVSCTIGTMANGASAIITIVAGTNPPDGMISNTASVTANEDQITSNNSATATTNVGDISRLVGISTRARVETGPDVMVGGFSFGGVLPKQILIRGRGPSLSGPPYNFPGTLTNPILEIYSGPTLFAVVDNWQSGATQCDAPATSCGTPAEMQAISVDPCQPNVGQTTAPPGCAQEAAFLITVPPGAYTARLKGVNDEMGKGIIEVYDPDTSTMPKVEGISTRAKVLTGSDIMVGGFQIGSGSSNKKVLIRGRGPSLSGAPYNFTGTLANPKLEIYSGQTLFATIDDWGTGVTMCNAPAISCGTPAELQAALVDPCQPNNGQTTAPPGCNQETALFITLPPGAYTAQVKGVDNGTGIGIVEIYEMP